MTISTGYLHRLAQRILFNVRHPVSLAARIRYLIFPTTITLSNTTPIQRDKTSILIITFGALEYVTKCLSSLNEFRPDNSEIIVYDNGSDSATLAFLRNQFAIGKIDKLHLSSTNLYFVRGNNEAAKLASEESKYYLLLNSDTEIIDHQWFEYLLSIMPRRGIGALGYVSYPFPRPDGWCFMVDAKTFTEIGGLNDHYQMNWGITDFTSRVLERGLPVNSIVNPASLVVHHGGKSYGKKQRDNKFNFMTTTEVIKSLAHMQQGFFTIKR